MHGVKGLKHLWPSLDLSVKWETHCTLPWLHNWVKTSKHHPLFSTLMPWPVHICQDFHTQRDKYKPTKCCEIQIYCQIHTKQNYGDSWEKKSVDTFVIKNCQIRCCQQCWVAHSRFKNNANSTPYYTQRWTLNQSQISLLCEHENLTSILFLAKPVSIFRPNVKY
jgi:hypothetical protein